MLAMARKEMFNPRHHVNVRWYISKLLMIVNSSLTSHRFVVYGRKPGGPPPSEE